jgi:rhamnogalacturonan endolyase
MIYKSWKLWICGMVLLAFSTSWGARNVEKLDRGVLAIQNGSSVFVSWRLLGYESKDIAFDLFRDGVKLNDSPITGATNYTDSEGSSSANYTVRAILNGQYIDESEPVKPWAELTKRIPLNRPAGGSTQSGNFDYSPNDASVGDLTGNGKWDIVLKWDPSNSQDNSKGGFTGNVLLDGVTLDGEHLWRIDLGKNIRAGAHYTQFVVADFDLDGKAEIVVKTAPGTKDASGNFISKGAAANAIHSADYRNGSGYVLEGPEYLTIFSGDGLELATVDYNPPRGNVGSWGDTYGNRVDRFLATAAYLDGVKPSAVMQRGYYTRMAIAAWDWDGTSFTQRWFFDSNAPGNSGCHSQGNHSVAAGDVDGDGFDEIIQGACAIDHDGSFMYGTGLGHGDAHHLADLDPDRPGLEMFSVHEEKHINWPGTEVHDARTGDNLFEVRVDNIDVGRGMAADIDGNHRGYEVWSTASGGIYNIKGNRISTSGASVNFRMYWDGDLQDELVDAIGSPPSPLKIESWNGSGFDRLLSTDNRYGNYSSLANNWTKANPVLVADILGDWREELIMRQNTNDALIIYSTTIPTPHRLFTLMHDPHYRISVSWQNVAYNQPPHLGFYIGDGVDHIPMPNVVATGGGPRDCAGVEDGTATLDACGRCTGGTTGAVACSGLLEAETYCEAMGTVDNNHSGFSGTGFLNVNNATGSHAIWALNAAQSGDYTLYVKYANGSTAERPVRVTVNGLTQVESLAFPATGAWGNWGILELSLSLESGSNLVSFTSVTDDGPANLDLLGFGEQGLSEGSCEVTTIAHSGVNDGASLTGNPTLVNGSLHTHSNGTHLQLQGVQEIAMVTIYNANGALVQSLATPQESVQLHLPNGFYSVMIHTHTGRTYGVQGMVVE